MHLSYLLASLLLLLDESSQLKLANFFQEVLTSSRKVQPDLLVPGEGQEGGQKKGYDVPFNFSCPTEVFRSHSPPTDVNQLRPGDIDIVAALGDSLTAGNGAGADSLMDMLTNYRGLSWSIGGHGTWKEQVTLPNILKEFNPSLLGYSTGNGPSESKEAFLNVAASGALDDDLLSQAQQLVAKMGKDPRIDINNHWKLVTINIGGNDLCTEACRKEERNTAEMHKSNIEKALDYLQEKVPRVLVNLVSTPDVTVLNRMKKPILCKIFHSIMCPCLCGMDVQPKQSAIEQMAEEYRRVEMELAQSGKYEKEDFAVVLQPFSSSIPLSSQNDLSLFSHDCFHLSQRGNACVANSLWNNLLEPVGNKTKQWEPEFSRVLCPSEENPYFFTNKNSEMFHKSGSQIAS